VLVALALAGCGGDDGDGGGATPVVEDPGPIHVHGLGVNPADGALFIATHTGLFRLADGESRAERVGDRLQDTMGFTVVGPDRFLGSGHPDGRDRLPPFLGLVRSTDAGRSWTPVSLLGEADFHVLEADDRRVYGFGSDFESREARFLTSSDRGRSWSRLDPPGPLLSLAIEPGRPDRFVAATTDGLHAASRAGREWRALGGEPGLLSWAGDGTLYRVDAGGAVGASDDRGRSWEERGRVAGEPAAFEAGGGRLFAALHDGSIVASADGGLSWRVISRP